MKKVLEVSRSKHPQFLEVLSNWAEQFEYFSLLNSNQYKDEYGAYELLGAFGKESLFELNSLKELSLSFESRPRWLFGHITYDFKNHLEKLSSRHEKKTNFNALSFFEPSYLLMQKSGEDKVELFINKHANVSLVDDLLNELEQKKEKRKRISFVPLKSRQSKQEYIHAIEQLKEEIQYGNIYEINYCQEFYAENVSIDPSRYYTALNEKSTMPFSVFYKNCKDYLICASPERYLCKRGDMLYSQPIKGTAKRGATVEEDENIKKELQADLKEQTENVMIVDLVRNDMSRTAAKASVQVKELFGVYTFPQVHQLISTIESQLSSRFHFTDAIQYSFPMGSMTGAPKVSAMLLADRLEASRRELYSGTVGYISPEGDFDFNVVIRSLSYSKERNYLSLTVGGAITKMSNPESEYEECLLKAKAIFELQNG